MSQQTDAQIDAKIDDAYTGGADKVEWTEELKIIVKDINDSKVNRADSDYTELTSDEWDGSNKYFEMTENRNIILSTEKFMGLLVIEANDSYVLSINDIDVPVNAETSTVIGFTKANNFYYVIDKDGLTIQIGEPGVPGEEDLNFDVVTAGFAKTANYWTGPIGGYNDFGLADKKIAAGDDGYVELYYEAADGTSAVLAFRHTEANQNYLSLNYKGSILVAGGNIYGIDNGGNAFDTGVAINIGEFVRLSRTGTTIKIQKRVALVVTDVYTHPEFASGADLFIQANTFTAKRLYSPIGFNLSAL